MFGWFLKSQPLFSVKVTKTEQHPLGLDDHEFGESVDGTARIRQMKNGKFRLLVNQNEVVGTYSRKRDAIRGAMRKGLTVLGEAN
jgi:hypothetical protein